MTRLSTMDGVAAANGRAAVTSVIPVADVSIMTDVTGSTVIGVTGSTVTGVTSLPRAALDKLVIDH